MPDDSTSTENETEPTMSDFVRARLAAVRRGRRITAGEGVTGTLSIPDFIRRRRDGFDPAPPDDAA